MTINNDKIIRNRMETMVEWLKKNDFEHYFFDRVITVHIIPKIKFGKEELSWFIRINIEDDTFTLPNGEKINGICKAMDYLLIKRDEVVNQIKIMK